MEKIYCSFLEVRGYELDSFGHVNHAEYVRYLEHARWQVLRTEGIGIPELKKFQIWPVIAEIQLKYLKPTFLGDLLAVTTRVVSNTRTQFVFEQTVFKTGSEAISKDFTQALILQPEQVTLLQGEPKILEALVRVVTVNASGRPTETPLEFQALWS